MSLMLNIFENFCKNQDCKECIYRYSECCFDDYLKDVKEELEK